MKRLFTLLLTSVLISGNFQTFAQQAKDSDSTSFAQITFEVTDHSFGEVTQGEKVEHIFKFKNTGNFPLILQNVLTTCGCTVPEWPKEPIAPAEEGILRVIFDSTAKIGRQNKVITIRSNSKSGDYRLRISAMVLPPKEDE
jgi:hypothetical protein